MRVEPVVHEKCASGAARAPEATLQSLGCAIAEHAHHARQGQSVVHAANRDGATHDSVPGQPLGRLSGGCRQHHGRPNTVRKTRGKFQRHLTAQRTATYEQRHGNAKAIQQPCQHRRLIARGDGGQRLRRVTVRNDVFATSAQQRCREDCVSRRVDGSTRSDDPAPPLGGPYGSGERVHNEDHVVAIR